VKSRACPSAGATGVTGVIAGRSMTSECTEISKNPSVGAIFDGENMAKNGKK